MNFLQINVIDDLSDTSMYRSTSIVSFLYIIVSIYSPTSLKHWHGLFQHGTTEMDGPAFVSQYVVFIVSMSE